MHRTHSQPIRHLVYPVFLALTSLALLTLGVALAQARAPQAPAASVVYVDASATGADDGSSWADAYTDLQGALTTVVSGTQVWVAEGMYKPTAVITDRIAAFQLVDGVALYGGFPAGGGGLGDRDPDTCITILSGDIDGNDLNIPVTNTSQIVGGNSYHVVTSSGAGPSTRLDGFTISGGQANGSYPHNTGGGIYNDNSNPALVGITFSGNLASDKGGGVFNTRSSPTLMDVVFSGNLATNYGGGMYNLRCSPVLTDVIFTNNSVTNSGSIYGGGGMYNYINSSPTLKSVTFSSNSATNYGGGLCNSESSNPALVGVIFTGNSANSGGGMQNSNDSSPTLTNVIFDNNSANGSGAGMQNTVDCSPILTDVIFRDNLAIHYGGGIDSRGNCNPTLTNVTFISNSANYGGGMSNRDYSNPTLKQVAFNGNWTNGGSGGGIYNDNNSSSNSTLTDVIFVSNSATSGGGMYSEYTDANNSLTLTNVAFIGNLASDCGGGMYHNNDQGNLVLMDVSFSDNAASDEGGGMYNNYSNLTLINVNLGGNVASHGGGMYIKSGSNQTLSNVTFSSNAATSGGGIYSEYGHYLMLLNVTFSDNTATNGGGIYSEYSEPTLTNVTFSGNSALHLGGGMYNRDSLPQIQNSILWGNTANSGTIAEQQIYNTNGSQPFIHYTLVQGSGGSGAGWDPTLGTDGGGNLNANPAFLRQPNPGPDTVWGTADDDYGDLRLQSTSPAIDAGDNGVVPTDTQDLDGDGNTGEPIPFDLAGNPRQVDIITTPDTGAGSPPIVDLGAYEVQPFLSLAKSVIPARAGPGQQVSYLLTFHNVGPDTATGVFVTDTMPLTVTGTCVSSSLPITATSPGLAYAWAWAIPDLPPGARGVITLTGVVTTALDGGETLWNTAVITAHEPDPNPQDNQATTPLHVTEIIYVDASASGANTGASWADAWTDLQAALGRAYPGVQIWVAAGVYKPTAVSTDRTATFQLVDGVEIYGGFPLGGSVLTMRDPAANPTILSGDIDDDDVSVPATTAADIRGSNSYHVVTSDGVRPITLLDGLTISGGQANGAGYSSGGGLYNVNNSRLRLQNVVFSGNYAINGGGLYNAASSPTLVDVTWRGNQANSNGGGLYTDSSNPALTNGAFHGNKASSGGGAYSAGSSAAWCNVILAGNAAGGNGGGLYTSGGSPILTNATFASNKAGNLGGGMYNQSSSTPRVDNSIFWGNTSASSVLAQKQIANVSATPVVHYSLIQGALASGAWNTSLGVDGGGNVDADPAFVRFPDPGPDAAWGTADDDYGDLRLQAQSAAIDAGDNIAVPADSQDLDGDDDTSEPTPYDRDNNPRFTDVTTTPDTGIGPPPIVDMGAYEAQLRLRVRVTRAGGAPAAGARVYHLPTGQIIGAEPLGGVGSPLLTNAQGDLQAPGAFQVGDGLLAAWPITATESYTVYYTSGAPTPTGLDWQAITDTEIIQHLVVSPDYPLVLFDLTVSLEWDARYDQPFLEQLRFDLQRTSEFLYDWTNGQAALGQVTIYHDREHWLDAHVRVYASNRMRPNASQGGIVTAVITDPLTSTITYQPGQVRMGAVWNRYGDSDSSLGEDWPRTLAHELGHYAFFLDDDYLGLDATGLLVPVSTCTGTVMTDPYRSDDSEFHPGANWLPGCQDTLANRATGRSDWATIVTFYPWLDESPANPGPSGLPLVLPQIQVVEPITPSTTLPVPMFYLMQDGHHVQPGGNARAVLFHGDWLTDLGRPVIDHVEARGAQPGDRLCVYEPAAGRLGCETITPGDDQLTLVALPDWQPEILVSPVTSCTMVITVTNVPPGLPLWGRLFSVNDPAPPAQALVEVAGQYTRVFTFTEPTVEGYVHIWVDESEPRREMVTDFALGGSPSHARGRWSNARGRWSHARGRWAPATSADGQVILFGDDLEFEEGEFLTLQAATLLPSPVPWTTVVGQAYRLIASPNAPNLAGTSLVFSYLGSEVPPGEETWLRVYFWDGVSWRQLPTRLDTYHNMASAATQGAGLYALMSCFEIPLHGPGWDSFGYTVQETRPVTEALLSISGYYTMVYGYEPEDELDPWKLYDVTALQWVNDLEVLEYGESYWILMAESITLCLRGAEDTSLAAANLPGPPATYYGSVLAGLGFTPTVGMTVTAWVDGHLCGQGWTFEADGQVVYVVHVSAADWGSAYGCGAPGQTVVFQVGQAMAGTAVWDNYQVQRLPLSLLSVQRFYLPLVVKGQ
ncbi:MAG: DUF11 domain-containing protein [Chloroflexi bacterium]|nr:DUF11 domain-containing protein [Chloroflexota bacterium]MBU1750493.1 DUF11 domain-containing protein [Chloroflexota bacterium]